MTADREPFSHLTGLVCSATGWRHDGDRVQCCREGAATTAAAEQLREGGWLSESDVVVALNTGAGYTYPDVVDLDPPVIPRERVVP